MEVSDQEDPNNDFPIACQDVIQTSRPLENTKGVIFVSPCVIIIVLSSFNVTFGNMFCLIGDDEV